MMYPAETLVHGREQLESALGRRYQIQRLIGRGAMSSVYLAREPALQREVAIKVLSPVFECHLEDRERFRREARIAAMLAHPNIVPVYAFHQENGVTFSVMPYIAGGSLAQRLDREGRLLPKDVSRLLAALAGAVDCVHRHGVVHRDIKPANVLLDGESGRPMLTDFGVATLRTSEHSRSEVPKAFGTPHYMSPEQALGELDCDGRSDLYALGVLGFQLLTGRLPFNGISAAELAAQHVALDPPSLEHVITGVPERLAGAIGRCLAKDPDARWPDGKSLRAGLLAAARDRAPRWWDLKAWASRFRGSRDIDAAPWVASQTPSCA